jgi:NAD(P)H-hydrate epimerase
MRKIPGLPELAPRRADSNKGDYGRVLVLAGSRGMVGAAAMAGTAALRAGAGLVTVGTPRSVYPILAAQVVCCTTRPLPETPAATLSDRGSSAILEWAESFDVVALGPGLGRHPSTTRLVHHLVLKLPKPMVLDADGLNALAEDVAVLRRAPAPRILTPHPGEMARLAGLSVGQVQQLRKLVALRFARENRVVLVLKGHRSIVTDGRRVFVNPTGNPGMATGGAGDVLTGAIAALIGQRLGPFEAAVLGTYVHGLSGDLAAKRFGEVGLIATDVLDFLPKALRKLAAGKTNRTRPAKPAHS